MKRLVGGVLVGLVAVLVVPVLVAQLGTEEHRHLEAISPGETAYREVTFRNEEQGLQLAGMLFEPNGDGPFPAVVIIQGSGTSHRDNGWYLTLVHDLQRHGIAVLLPDKRGSAKSEGNWRSASFEDLATDTLAAVQYIKEQGDVAITQIGVIGMSQGGHIAPLVADQSDAIDFVVNVVGGAVPMHQALVYEETHNLRELGVLPGLAHVLAYPAAWSIIYLRQKEFWDEIGNFDPLPYWRKLEVPALVLYGAEDTNTPSKKSAELLRGLDKPNIEVLTYKHSGHALASPRGKGNSIFRADARRDIREFIEQVASANHVRSIAVDQSR